MTIEYQIDIDYVANGQGKNLSYRFENAEIRNTTYQSICSELANDQVDMNYLKNYGGVTVSTYNYSDSNKEDIAQIVSHTSFKIEVLNKILELVESK